MKNYYEILGVEKDATDKEIKSAYRSKAMIKHPDRGGTDKEFAELNEAHEVLSDPARRARYDNSENAEFRSEADELERQATTGVMQIFDGIFNSPETPQLDRINLQDQMLAAVKQGLEQLKGEIRKIRRSAVKTRKFKRRLKKGDVIFFDLLRQKRADAWRRYRLCQKQLRVAERMIELVNSIEYDRDTSIDSFGERMRNPGYGYGDRGFYVDNSPWRR